MMLRKQLHTAVIGCMMVPLLLAGCSGGGESPRDQTNMGKDPVPGTEAVSPGKEELSSDPVTIKLYSYNAGINTEQDLHDLFIKPVQDKYPQITIEQIKDVKMDAMVAANEIPDLIVTSNYYLREVLDYGLGSDLNDWVERDGVDLSKLDRHAMKVMEQFGEGGELYGIPYSMNYGVLLYNKDIFDLLGVDYPTDNMTWDEVVALARKVTQTVDGVSYIGLDPGPIQAMIRSRSLPVVDEAGSKAAIDNEEFRQSFQLLKEIYSIPGIVGPDNKYSYGMDFFMKEKRLAMHPYWIAATQSRVPIMQETGVQWDMVSYPQFSDRPGIGREVDFHLAVVPQTAKNKEAAYRVIETLISEEAQIEMNKGSRLTIMEDPELRNQYSSSANSFEGKNLQGIYSVDPAPLPVSTRFDTEIYKFLREGVTSMVADGVDVNTAVRVAGEKADQFIQEAGQ
ncbi:ABC transporter substrate-binding protein [Paenibacillus sp. J2TS4]|uniref:ABC transporter substrate-binding protein n=1 Tax=Paenibacillus sp. J2TS4 TaxID=2807194 RepID=UPI001B1D21E2|nr:extracellular solute-binding protein [Paenibacillus sp. J2TS4]GIP31053.1 hypothetical protein J2TS4_02630 [Paenibacillus sp. J2TS4]